MSNSSLVTHIKLSPNCSKPRLDKIDSIVIHHMAGVLSAEQCGNVFASTSRQASSNYGVDSNGNVGLYVDESNRSWATSSPAIDNRAVTIEVSNDGEPNWHVSDKALKKTIELCADICKRNGIKKLNYTGDKSGNLHMHRWYAATSCPGDYLASKFPYIANEVNKIINKNGDELNMTQYEELKKIIANQQENINKQQKEIDELKKKTNPMIYNYIDDNMPSWARPTITKLVKKGNLKGNEKGELGLTDEMIRIYVTNDRAGLYD